MIVLHTFHNWHEMKIEDIGSSFNIHILKFVNSKNQNAAICIEIFDSSCLHITKMESLSKQTNTYIFKNIIKLSAILKC